MKEAAENFQSQPIFEGTGGRRLIRGLAVMLAAVILLAAAISACGTSSPMATSTTRAATTAAGGTWATTTAPGFDKGGIPPATTVPPILPTGTAQPTSGTRPSDVPVKIIRNASLELETPDVEKTYQELLAFAAVRGGYEASRRLTTNENNAYIEARIKIAPQYLDEFLNHAGNAAKVLNVQTTSQDVTESYYDAQTRLRTLEQMLAKYTDFLNRAANVNEALSVQSEINRLTAEIESLKGRLRYYDTLVAESTITLVIRKLPERVQTTREVRWNALTLDDMWYLMRSGLVTVANTITNILQWLLIVIVAISPLLVIALIVWLVIRKRRGPRPPRDGRKNRPGLRSWPGERSPDDRGGRSDRLDERPGAWRRQENVGAPAREEPLIPPPQEEPLVPPQDDEPPVPPGDAAAAPPSPERTVPPDGEVNGIVAPGFAEPENPDGRDRANRLEDDPRRPAIPEIPDRQVPEEIPPRVERPEIPSEPEIPEIIPEKPDRINPTEPTPEIPDRRK